MMLYMLGSLRIEVHPFNVHQVGQTGATEYAVKPVVGVEPPLEFVGEGSNELSLSGRLFPAELGGLDELALLERMRGSGRPQYLMRGDGRPMGWWAILSVATRSSHLSQNGVGRKVEVDISLRRAGPPPATAYFSLMAGLFA